MKTSSTEGNNRVDYGKVFLYGFLSVLTFGTIPSYLHRMNPPHVDIPSAGDYSFENGVVGDLQRVAQDIAAATEKAYSSQNA